MCFLYGLGGIIVGVVLIVAAITIYGIVTMDKDMEGY